MQERCNSSALSIELRLSCTSPSMCVQYLWPILHDENIWKQLGNWEIDYVETRFHENQAYNEFQKDILYCKKHPFSTQHVLAIFSHWNTSVYKWHLFRNPLKWYNISIDMTRSIWLVLISFYCFVVSHGAEIKFELSIYYISFGSYITTSLYSQIAKFMGPTWGPPGSCRPQMGPCWPHEPCY